MHIRAYILYILRNGESATNKQMYLAKRVRSTYAPYRECSRGRCTLWYNISSYKWNIGCQKV